ncbi:unnamed protein product [Bubo scandiacus]
MFTPRQRRKWKGRGLSRRETGRDREAPPPPPLLPPSAAPPSRHGKGEGGGPSPLPAPSPRAPSPPAGAAPSHPPGCWCLLKRENKHSFCEALLVLPVTLMFERLQAYILAYNNLIYQSDQQLDCALDLMRRLPPQQIEKNLSDLIDLVPSLCEDLLSSVDQPLKIARDKVVGKDYLLCDYNRDGDSYRSPWSNKYDPPLEDGAMPSARLRKLEVEANNAFDQYRDLYFEGGVSSVYLWDLDHGFAGVILIKKAGDGSKKIKGCWDSIHVVEVQEKSSGRTAHYKLTSTVMLWLQTNKTGSGTMNLGGSLTRQMEKDETVSDSSPHIANIGRLVEDMENKIRSTLNEIYFGKTKDIVNGLRSIDAIPDNQKYKQLQRELSQVLTQRQIYIQPDN